MVDSSNESAPSEIASTKPFLTLKLSEFGTKLKALAGAAQEAGVKAQYYFARGTSMEAFRLAEKWLGKENVYWYDQ